MSFLTNKIKEREQFIEKTASDSEKVELLTDLLVLSAEMFELGVGSEADYRDYFYIKANCPSLTREKYGKEIDVVEKVYRNRQEMPINTIINFHKAVEAAVNAYMIKKAYPQGYENVAIQYPYNIAKWVEATKQIYAFKTRGLSSIDAFNKVTAKWPVDEKNNYQYWLKYYQSGGHVAYKTAQTNNMGLWPMSALKSNLGDPSFIPEQKKPEISVDDIAFKVNKLIGRLNSAEKIFTSADFKKILGGEYEKWISYLHELKRILYNKQPRTASTIGDLFIRQGNKLRNDGCPKAGRLMDILAAYQVDAIKKTDAIIRLAQEAVPPPSLDVMPSLPTRDEETENTGADLADPDGAMQQFIENLKGGEEIDDKEADFLYEDAMIVVAEPGFYRWAQMAEPVLPQKPIKSPVKSPLPPQTSEKGNPETGDNAIDAALKNISLPDVVAKLEYLVQFYRNREMSRELLIVDLMLDAIGISAFFPSMAEAAKSALDSNQYVLTRLEDVLAKLRGATAAQDGTLESLKNKLQQQVHNQEKRKADNEKQEMQPGGLPEEGGKPEAPAAPAGKPEPAKEFKQPAKIEPSPQPAPVR